MEPKHVRLKWNNFHKNLHNEFESMHNSEELADVTLTCEGVNLKAHKFILSACSVYFRRVFKENPCRHPIIVLKNILYVDLVAIITYMYHGEVTVSEDNLETFLETAEILQVSGLTKSKHKSKRDESNVSSPNMNCKRFKKSQTSALSQINLCFDEENVKLEMTEDIVIEDNVCGETQINDPPSLAFEDLNTSDKPSSSTIETCPTFATTAPDDIWNVQVSKKQRHALSLTSDIVMEETNPSTSKQNRIHIGSTSTNNQDTNPGTVSESNQDSIEKTNSSDFVMEIDHRTENVPLNTDEKLFQDSMSSKRFETNNLNTVLENQKLLMNQNNKILMELEHQRFVLDSLFSNSNGERQIDTNAEYDTEAFSMLPIDTIEKMENLELHLLNKENLKGMVENMSSICGTTGKMNGLNCCYSIIDYFFKRDFLLNFSWGGGSRGSEQKAAFRKFENIISAFYEIIKKADAQFSKLECEKFFKGIIKNAKRRADILLTNKVKRASSAKNRPSNLTYHSYKVSSNMATIDDMIQKEFVIKEEPSIAISESSYEGESDEEGPPILN